MAHGRFAQRTKSESGKYQVRQRPRLIQAARYAANTLLQVRPHTGAAAVQVKVPQTAATGNRARDCGIPALDRFVSVTAISGAHTGILRDLEHWAIKRALALSMRDGTSKSPSRLRSQRNS